MPPSSSSHAWCPRSASPVEPAARSSGGAINVAKTPNAHCPLTRKGKSREEAWRTFQAYERLESAGRDFGYVLITNEFDAARLRAACERRRQNAPLFSQVVNISPAAVEVVYREGGAEGATAVRQHIASGRLMSFQAWLESIGAGPNPAAHRSRKK